MTSVIIKQKADQISYLEINDHAGFAKKGEDIVCAAISSIVFGALNALVEYNLSEDNIQVADVSIKISLVDTLEIQMIVKTMVIQLQTIQEKYPDYIQILFN